MGESTQVVCNGLCVMASDLIEGMSSYDVAYPHPQCPLHSPVDGDAEDHDDPQPPHEHDWQPGSMSWPSEPEDAPGTVTSWHCAGCRRSVDVPL